MLKHAIFSEYYLANRQQRGLTDESQRNTATADGMLALASDRSEKSALLIRRAPTKTWWENGWQNRR